MCTSRPAESRALGNSPFDESGSATVRGQRFSHSVGTPRRTDPRVSRSWSERRRARVPQPPAVRDIRELVVVETARAGLRMWLVAAAREGTPHRWWLSSKSRAVLAWAPASEKRPVKSEPSHVLASARQSRSRMRPPTRRATPSPILIDPTTEAARILRKKGSGVKPWTVHCDGRCDQNSVHRGPRQVVLATHLGHRPVGGHHRGTDFRPQPGGQPGPGRELVTGLRERPPRAQHLGADEPALTHPQAQRHRPVRQVP